MNKGYHRITGIKGKPVVGICTEHQISQIQYYQWQDQFMKELPKVFVNTERHQASLERENSRVKKIMGEFTVELKKTERVVRMKRRLSRAVEERNLPVVARIREIKADHPYWSYRRIWTHLKYVDCLSVNRERVFRLMQKHELVVKPDTRLEAIRTPQRSKPRPTRPYQWCGIDMTKVMVESFGWMYIVVVLDWYTKKIVSYYTGIQCRDCHWLEALSEAVNCKFPGGVRGGELSLMSDNGSQPTSVAFMKSCREMGINQAFTSYSIPKRNADTERVFQTMKEELL